jgi:hypothetical protein
MGLKGVPWVHLTTGGGVSEHGNAPSVSIYYTAGNFFTS